MAGSVKVLSILINCYRKCLVCLSMFQVI
uniref:Uncharacterized protein n=1 Tax=Rhizophora mucronata TaxID=61149 RepID=A0A2P2LWP9_RHIMU